MSLTLTFHTDRYRVQIAGTGWSADRVRIERSQNGNVWVPVRGGRRLPVEDGSFSLNDYDGYAPQVTNHYRVTDADDDGDTPEQESDTITPAHDVIVLKHVEFPAANRQVTVTDWSDISRAGRAGIHEVKNSPHPSGVHDLMTSQSFTVELMTDTSEQQRVMDLVLALGGVLLLHVPAGCPVPGGYILAQSMEQIRRTRSARSPRRYFNLACRIMRPPDADVLPGLLTWQTLERVYGSWEGGWQAHSSWLDLWQFVGDPEDVMPL